MANCNDGNHNWRSVIYSFGGTEQSPDGQQSHPRFRRDAHRHKRRARRLSEFSDNAWAVWKWANDPDTAKAFIVDWYDQWQQWGKVTSGYNSPPFLGQQP